MYTQKEIKVEIDSKEALGQDNIQMTIANQLTAISMILYNMWETQQTNKRM